MDEEYEYIYVAYITTKRGRRIYARECRLQAFHIKVRKRGPEDAA